jgi:hypothetical protein
MNRPFPVKAHLRKKLAGFADYKARAQEMSIEKREETAQVPPTRPDIVLLERPL